MASKGIATGECPSHGEFFMDAHDSPCPSCDDGESTPEVTRFINAVEEILDIARLVIGNYRPLAPDVENQLKNLIETINPRFPQDSLDVLDIVMATQAYALPDKETLDIIMGKVNDQSPSGTIRWKYRHNGGKPLLLAQICPKKSGDFFEVRFSSEGFLGGFPLTVTVEVDAYTDMDLQENHSDRCPMYFVEDHEEGCPVGSMIDGMDSGVAPEGYTDEDWKETEAECHCTSDTCDCESEIENTFQAVYSDDLEWGSVDTFLFNSFYEGTLR